MPTAFRDDPIIRAHLEASFPNLGSSRWEIKSPRDRDYNCFAWAACDDKRWWGPTVPPISYWPPSIIRENTVERFVQAFATMGYQPCDDASFEFGYQKVAIYADEEMEPTHMARQHVFGRGWLSKLGRNVDILHAELRDVEDDTDPTSQEYGRVVQILRRSWWTAVRFGLLRGWLAALKFWFYRLRVNYESG